MDDEDGKTAFEAPRGTMVLTAEILAVVVIVILVVVAREMREPAAIGIAFEWFARLMGAVLVILGLSNLVERRNVVTSAGFSRTVWIATVLILSGAALLVHTSWTGAAAALAVGLVFVAAAVARRGCARCGSAPRDTPPLP